MLIVLPLNRIMGLESFLESGNRGAYADPDPETILTGQIQTGVPNRHHG